MSRARLTQIGLILAVATLAAAWPVIAGDESKTNSSTLEARLDRLESLARGQGEMMAGLSYNFGNLWFAMDKDNWPLADFYLHESFELLDQAVEFEPQRTLSTGIVLPLKGIADALKNTQFTELKEAIADHDKKKAAAAYRSATLVCTSCHMASEKPFLRVRVPTAPPNTVIDFEPPGMKMNKK